MIRHVVAVALREVREIARRRALFLLRAANAAALVFVVLVAFADRERVPAVYAGSMTRGLFEAFVYFQSFLAVALGSVLALASIRAELRDKTLGLLLLSGLHPVEVLLGKVLGLSAMLAAVLGSTLPVLALLGWGGGLDYAFLPKALLLFVALVALGTAIGLAAGLAFRGVAFGSLFIVLWTLAVFPAWLPATLWPDWLPLHAIVTVAEQGLGSSTLFLEPTVAVFGAAIVLLLISAVRLDAAVGRRGGFGLKGLFEAMDRVLARANVGGVTFGAGRSRHVGSRPVAWLVRTSGGLGLPRYVVRSVMALLFGTFLLAAFLPSSGPAQGTIAFALFLVTLGAPVAAAFAGGNAIAGERERHTLVPLLATPLSSRRILLEKTLGVAFPVLVVVAVLLAIQAFIGTVSHSREIGVFLFLNIAAGSALAYALSLLVSLWARTGVRAAIAGLVCAFLVSSMALFFIAIVTMQMHSSGEKFPAIHAVVISALAFTAYVTVHGFFDTTLGRAE